MTQPDTPEELQGLLIGARVTDHGHLKLDSAVNRILDLEPGSFVQIKLHRVMPPLEEDND